MLNPYNPCVANQTVNGEQQTVCWHADDLKVSHVDPEVNEQFARDIIKLYGDTGCLEINSAILGRDLISWAPAKMIARESFHKTRVLITRFVKKVSWPESNVEPRN